MRRSGFDRWMTSTSKPSCHSFRRRCRRWSPSFREFQEQRERSRAGKGTAFAKHEEKFARKWNHWTDALPVACEFLFNLNRYAKHRSCSRENRAEIYDLKNEFIALLYKRGLCARCWTHVIRLSEKVCFRCDGDGTGWNGDECGKCDGSGVYREASEIEFYCFRFEVGDKGYTWHQPDSLVSFEPAVTGPPQEWDGNVGVRPLKLPRRKLTEGKRLILIWRRNGS